MAAAIGRDALMFGIHSRRLAGVPKVVGTLITGSHGAPGDGFRQACREALAMRRSMPFGITIELIGIALKLIGIAIGLPIGPSGRCSPVDDLTKRRLRSRRSQYRRRSLHRSSNFAAVIV